MKAFTSVVAALALATSAIAETITVFNDPDFRGTSATISLTLEVCQNLPASVARQVSSARLGNLQCGFCDKPCLGNGQDGFCRGPLTGNVANFATISSPFDNRAVTVFCVA